MGNKKLIGMFWGKGKRLGEKKKRETGEKRGIKNRFKLITFLFCYH